MARGTLYTPKADVVIQTKGGPVMVRRGERVREGHEALRGHEDMFEPVEDSVHYDVEQATAAPGEKRGQRAGS